MFGLYQRAEDLYLGRWVKGTQWKCTFTEEDWIKPTRGGFVTVKMNNRCRREIYIYRRSLDYTNARWICTYEDEKKMQNGNLNLSKKFGLYQGLIDLYLWRWMKDGQWKFTSTEEVWIIPTCGGFASRKIKERCGMEIYISRRSLDYTNRQWLCTYEDE